jgi:chemotaxis family two-component system response regulator Rcp1
MLSVTNALKPIEILLVDDDSEEAELTMTTLRQGRVANRVLWVEDGEDALAVLRKEGRFAHAPRPELVLLDLNMPRMGGMEVLAEIKRHPDWRRLPVIIMTSSSAETDILNAYDRHANCFITKPVDVKEFVEAVRSIEDFWLGFVRLPAA